MILIPVSSSQREAKRKLDTGTTIISTRSLPLGYPAPNVQETVRRIERAVHFRNDSLTLSSIWVSLRNSYRLTRINSIPKASGMNPDTDVTSRKRVHNATLYLSTRDDHRIRTPHCSAQRFTKYFSISVPCIIIQMLQFEPTKANTFGVL